MIQMRRSLADLVANADALAEQAGSIANQFETYDPNGEDLERPMPPIMAVKLAAYRRDAAEAELAEAVAKAREAEVPWRAVGEAIGTSGEAARQRYTKAPA